MAQILAITSLGQCGIAEYYRLLAVALVAGEHDVRLLHPGTEAPLDPAALTADHLRGMDAVWLNYHAGLHAGWTVEHIRELAASLPVILTYHDTLQENPRAVWDKVEAATQAVVHEGCDLLTIPTVSLIRQGVHLPSHVVPHLHYHRGQRPILGTLGFDFPWKQYDLIAEVTAELGWGFSIAGQLTEERRKALQRLNPWLEVTPEWPTPNRLVDWLRGCDASVFLYTCANTGTSGAIRYGLAGGKPVIAAAGCRQFRDLHGLPGVPSPITWIAPTRSDLRRALQALQLTERPNPGIWALAHAESWSHKAAQYAEVFRAALERQP